MKPLAMVLSAVCIIALIVVAGFVYLQQAAPRLPDETSLNAPAQVDPAPAHVLINGTQITIYGSNVTVASVPPEPGPADKPAVAPTPTKKTWKDYFISMTFGMGGKNLDKWDDPVVKVGLSGSYTESDTAFLDDFATLFNRDLSQTTKIGIYPGLDNQPIELVLIPESHIRSLELEPVNGILDAKRSDGTTVIFYRYQYPQHVPYLQKRYYINNELPDLRNVILLTALLDGLGFSGGNDDPTSFFYKENFYSTNLSYDDEYLIKLMYNTGMKRNMTATEVQAYIH